MKLRTLIDDMRQNRGSCFLATHHYATIPGSIYSRGQMTMIPANFHYIIKWQRTQAGWKAIIKFLDGPTGWEGYYIDDILLHKPDSDYFCICAGCDQYPEARIDTKEFLKAIALFQDWMPAHPESLTVG